MPAIVCPPKKDPRWQQLVAELGEERAYISFFRNGHDFPSVEQARTRLSARPPGYRTVSELRGELAQPRGGAEAVQTAPDYQYTVQRQQTADGKVIPGYVQIDQIIGGDSAESGSIEKFREKGVNLPAVPDWLPQGQYTLKDIQQAILRGNPDTVEAKIDVTAASEQPRPFAHGKVVEGEPSLDFRTHAEYTDLTPEQWGRTVGAVIDQGGIGSSKGNRAETRVALAMQAPDGRVVVTGIVRPQRILGVDGKALIKEPALQRMSVVHGDQKAVEVGGAQPATVRDVVAAGFKPIAVLHFDAEPGKIHETFRDQAAFDKAWAMTEKSAGARLAETKPVAQALTERQVDDRLEALVREHGDNPPDAILHEMLDLIRQRDELSLRNQDQTGDQPDVPFRTEEAQSGHRAAVAASRTTEFNAVAMRMRNLGMRVDLMTQEFLAQATKKTLQRRLDDIMGQIQRAADEPARAELQRRADIMQERLASLEKAGGVAYAPWHVGVAMDDVLNANTTNLVRLLHEASESMGMRLPTEMRGRVTRAIEQTMVDLRGQTEAAATQTGVPASKTVNALDLLSEHLAQKLTAEGVPDAPSIAGAIVRWIKDLYYRVAMAAQASFGIEASPELALGWFENQLRREVSGDFDYRLARIVDRFTPESSLQRVAKLQTMEGTPGAVVDFVDPISRQMKQPSAGLDDLDALNWNLQLREEVPGHESELDIPDPEARARIMGASLNDRLEFYTQLKQEIDPENKMPFESFWLELGRLGKNADPRLMLGELANRMKGAEAAKIGGERMTKAMNDLAGLDARAFMRKVSATLAKRHAEAIEAVDTASARLVEVAQEANKLEADPRNAALHEDTLRQKARAMVRDMVKAYDRGLDTAHTHGELADAIRRAEGLLESDPIPENYQRILKALHDGDIKVFDYVRAISELDLPLTDLEPAEILAAIRENGEQNPTLTQLAENKPLAVALATLAHDNAVEVDQIQLGWLRDTSEYRKIHAQLEEIRGAGQDKLKGMYKLLDEQRKAVGLAERVKLRYLEKRREIQRTSERIARMEARRQLIERALPSVKAKLDALEQAHGGHYSEWTPSEGKEYTAMRSQPDGSFRKTTRVLKFNRDGSAVDSEQVRSDIAHNREWLDVNAKQSGKKIYESIKRQTYELANLDVQRQYAAGWNWGMLGWFDKFVRTPSDWARTAGHSAGERVAQQINRFQFILRSFGEPLKPAAYRWEAARSALMRESGVKDIGDFRSRIYDPVSYALNINPGLDEGAAIREAQRVARRRLPGAAGEGFNAAVAEFVRATKEQSTALDRLGRQYGVYVRDARLGNELRDSVARGWLTSPRMLRGQAVSTIIAEMEKAGWKLDYRTETDAKGQPVRKGIKAVTFAAIDPDNARIPPGSTPEQARAILDQYFARLSDPNAIRTAFQKLFTPGIVSRWLEPFIDKPGTEVFYHEKQPIPQADVHDAWVASGGDVLGWIDRLGQSLQLATDDAGHDPQALFRLSMMRQIDRLFGMESRMAYQHSQTRDVFDPMGPRRHLMMDSRVSDMIPPEHLEFATFDPEMTHKILGALAFHSAFGRNGEGMITNLKELRDVIGPQKSAYDSLRGTTRGARVAEAKAMGYDYKELQAANRRYADVLQLQGNLRSIFGVDNPSGPFYDLQGAFALLGGMAGQITDNPKTAAYNLIANTMRPFAMHSLGPATVSATVKGYGNFLYQAVGSFLENFGVHLLRSSQYAKDIGSVHGAMFRNLPWGVIYSDQGSKGRLEESRFIKPLARIRATQEKGVQVGFGEAKEFPRLAPIPGLGVLHTIADMASRAFGEAHIRQFEDLVTRGAAYYKAHPEASADPSHRFTYGQLGMMKLDAGVLDYFRNRSVEYNMGTIEDVVRGSMKRLATGERVLTRDQAINIAMMYANEMDGHASLNTTPAILQTNPLFRAMLPLMRWPLWMMHATHQGLSTLEGRQSFKAMAKGLGTLALWNLPTGIAFSLMIDWYDDKLLGKKANTLPIDPTAAIPIVGPALALAAGNLSPRDNMLAMLTRSARAGNIYGMGWDVAAQVFGSYDPSTGVRQFSLDQRVLAMSQFLNFQQALSNAMHQGDATWSTVWKPLFTSMGGNGAIHALDLANNAFGLDNAESRLVMRINASNWLRAAGREAGIETRGGNIAAQPGALGMWTREMQLAAMAGDRAGFLESYRKALNTARETVGDDQRIPAGDREREATNRVLSSWRARNPLEVFHNKPTEYQMAQLYSAMSDEGQADVREALNRYQTFTSMIAPSKQERAFTQSIRTEQRQFSPEALRRRMSPTLSLSSQ